MLGIKINENEPQKPKKGRGDVTREAAVLSLVISQKHARTSSPILHLIQQKNTTESVAYFYAIRQLNSHFIEYIRFVTLTTSTTPNES